MKWEITKLDQVCEIIAGQSPESQYYNQSGDGLPFFQGKADFGLHTPTVRFYSSKVTKKALPGDILLSVRAPVGPTNICNIESCIGRGLAAIRPRKDVHFKYLYYFFKSIEPKLSNTGNGSTFAAITTKDVKQIDIPVPPLSLQKQIADTLDKADTLRRKDEELLQKYDELAQSIFYDMFGDPVLNERGWKTKKLGNLCTVKRGASPRPINAFIGDEVHWIKIGDGTGDDDMFINDTQVKITKEGSKKSVLLQPGALIFANCGVSLGFARILKIAGCIHDGWLSFEVKNEKEITEVFLLKLINTITSYLRGLAPEGTQPNLNTGIMKELDVIVPPIDVQLRFSERVNKLLAFKKTLVKEANKSNSLYKSLENRYFS